MCTVSFVPIKDGIIITSNRDESIVRGKTIHPETYYINNTILTYPKDEKGAGTWIGFNEHNCIAVLLNGAFSKHNYKPPYKKSRGLLVTEVLSKINTINTIENPNFKGIEAFTLIVYEEKTLVEFRWDEEQLHKKILPSHHCHLWNSVTLYSKKMEDENREELNAIYSKNITPNMVLNFHETKKYETQLHSESLVNNIKTISITQVVFKLAEIEMVYKDLLPVLVNEKA